MPRKEKTQHCTCTKCKKLFTITTMLGDQLKPWQVKSYVCAGCEVIMNRALADAGIGGVK